MLSKIAQRPASLGQSSWSRLQGCNDNSGRQIVASLQWCTAGLTAHGNGGRRVAGCAIGTFAACTVQPFLFFLDFFIIIFLFFFLFLSFFYSFFYSFFSLFTPSLLFHNTTLLITTQFNKQSKLISHNLKICTNFK